MLNVVPLLRLLPVFSYVIYVTGEACALLDICIQKLRI